MTLAPYQLGESFQTDEEMLTEKDSHGALAHADVDESEEGSPRRLRHSTIQLRTTDRSSEYPSEPPPSMESIPPHQIPTQLASIIDHSRTMLLANDPGEPVPSLGKQETAADSQDFVLYIPESLTSAELNEQVTREIADAFREIFCNNAEYMVCQGCDNLIGASQAFDLPPDTNVPLSLLDSNLANACCDKCNSPMELLYDPEKTYEMFKEKFSHDAFITLLRSPRTKQIVGFTFAYERPMREVFEHEWKSRYMYTKNINPVAYNDYEAILQTAGPVLSKEVGYTIDDDSPIFCWNCVAISPTLRGSGAIKTMMSDFALSLPPDVVATRAVLGETRRGSKFHGILTSANMRTIEVGSEDYVLIGGALKNKCDRWVQTGLKKSA